LPTRASPTAAARAFGTIDALFADGMAAGMPDARGVSSDCPARFVASLRSAAAPSRRSLGVIREAAGG
jgi:hypothetical protein